MELAMKIKQTITPKTKSTKQWTKKKPSFRAFEYAKVKTLVNSEIVPLKIYEVNDLDTKFLDIMSQRINLKKLSYFKNATTKQLKEWKALINNAIMMSGFNEPQRTFLLTTEKNRPCGITTFNIFNKNCQIDYLATWRPAENERTKLAGTTLLKAIFEDVSQNETNKISLTTLTDSPIDLIGYYKRMGFGIDPTTEIYKTGTDMYILNSSIKETIKKLTPTINIEKVQNPKFVNLKQVLDIKY